jgi:hypothetical protein
MPRARLAMTLSQTPEYTIPAITESPRDLDFEPQLGDRFQLGHLGFWLAKVTGRRVGLDGVLVIEATFDDPPKKLVVKDFIGNGWMPDLTAVDREPLRGYLPTEDQGLTDPVEIMAHVAEELSKVGEEYRDLPRALEASIRVWRRAPSRLTG